MYLELNDVDGGGTGAGQGYGMFINAAATTTANVFEVDTDAMTTGHAMVLQHGMGTGTSHAMSGSMLHITDNNSSTTARAVVDILQNTTGATGTMGLRVTTNAGVGISVIQNKDKTGINVESSVVHSQPVARIVSNFAGGSAGQALYVQSKTTTMDTKIIQFANSSVDIFSALANGTVNFGGPSILSSNSTVTVNCRLGVKDTGGTVVNQT
jgi:hypothetical protein